jgi:hypothetical protein
VRGGMKVAMRRVGGRVGGSASWNPFLARQAFDSSRNFWGWQGLDDSNGPGADDGTRFGLIDVGVPRCICWRLVRTTGLRFLLAVAATDGKPAGLKTGATKPFAGVSPESKIRAGSGATGIVTRFQLSKPPLWN